MTQPPRVSDALSSHSSAWRCFVAGVRTQGRGARCRGAHRAPRLRVGPPAIAAILMAAPACSGNASSAPTTVVAAERPVARTVAADPAPPPTSVVVADVAARAGVGPPIASMPAADPSTNDWLTTEGSVVVEMVARSRPLWEVGEQACTSTAAELAKVGDPEAMLAAIQTAPDEPTRDVLVNLFSSIIAALAACGDSEFSERQAEFAWNWAVADNRVSAIGGT